MSKPSALIVEDRSEVAAIWGHYLEPLAIDIVNAHTLEEAFVILQKIPPPDLVLLDLNLGKQANTLYTINQITNIKTYNPDIIMIVISGMLTPDLINIAGQQDANAMHSKIEMQRQVDLWDAIKNSLEKAPPKAKSIFEYPLNLLESLAQKLHIL